MAHASVEPQRSAELCQIDFHSKSFSAAFQLLAKSFIMFDT